MSVDPTEAEGAHRGPAGPPVVIFPRRGDGLDPKRCVEVEAGIGGTEKIQRRRQGVVAEGQEGLDQPGSPGGGEQVADVGFDRTDGAEPTSGRIRGHQTEEAVHLHPIAHRGAGAVAFDEVHIPRRPSGLPVGLLHGPELAGTVRGQQVAAGVVGQSRGPDHRQDAVAVGQGVGQALEHHDAGPFAHHQAVGIGIERGAAARRGQGPQLAEAHLGVEAVRAGSPSSQNGVQAPGAQGIAGQAYGVQGAGAGGIQGETAAAKSQGGRQQGRRQGCDPGRPARTVVSRGGSGRMEALRR
jgi:hypothetical protein